MSCLLSVIIPVFNIKKYLGICLESLDKQTDKDFEIVFVDDGSTDGSDELCEKYKDSHENVILVRQKNQGAATARNNGVNNATGQYIAFIDSDDYICCNFIEELKRNILAYQADICISGMQLCIGDGVYKKKKDIKSGVAVYNTQEALENMLYGYKFGVQPCNKIYRRELIVNNPFPNVKAHEDLGMMYKVISQADKIIYCPNVTYYYRQRSGSISHIDFSEKNMYGLTAAHEQLEFIRENYPNLVKAAEFRILLTVTKWIRSIVNKRDKQAFAMVQKEIEPYVSSIMNNPKVRKSMKLRCFAICHGMLVTNIVYGLMDFVKYIKDKAKTRPADISELI